MTTVPTPTITPPEGAELAPPGWCYRCGTSPGGILRAIHDGGGPELMARRGGCADEEINPLDPAQLASTAAWLAAQEIWPGGIPEAIRPRLAGALGWVR